MNDVKYYMLYVDDREHAVSHLFQADQVAFKIERMDVGDYIIMDNNRQNLRAIFERKSLNDQSASIKDGRHENIQKLLDMRSQTDCDLYYIIETESYNGTLPIETVYTSIYNLMVRHKIQILFAKNVNETASILTKLVEVYTKIKPPISSISNNIDIDELSKKVCDQKTILNLWSGISGISKHTAVLLKQFNFIDYLRNDPTFVEKINILKYDNGKSLPAHVRMKLTTPVQYDIINSLSEIKGITKTIAQELSNIIDWKTVTEELLKNTKINGRKLGKYGSNLYILIGGSHPPQTRKV